MHLSESQALPVPLPQAWAALNELALLQAAIPGCESLLEIADDEFVGELTLPLGPMTGHCTVYIHRREIDAPHGCTLHFEASTTGAGGTGSAALRLVQDSDDTTTLQVSVEVQINGPFAQLAGPFVEVAARQMAAQFFERFRHGVVTRYPAAAMP
ncbi:MAG: SRPBCC domain-containing protein [Betaproteobacteria bacterium]